MPETVNFSTCLLPPSLPHCCSRGFMGNFSYVGKEQDHRFRSAVKAITAIAGPLPGLVREYESSDACQTQILRDTGLAGACHGIIPNYVLLRCSSASSCKPKPYISLGGCWLCPCISRHKTFNHFQVHSLMQDSASVLEFALLGPRFHCCKSQVSQATSDKRTWSR